MHSKISVWDFVLKFAEVIEENQFGIYVFYISDPFLEKIIFNRLPKEKVKFNFHSGNEITNELIEEKFVNLSFFTESENVIVFNAENINAEVVSKIQSDELDFSTKYLLLFYSKSNKSYLELSKNKKLKTFEIEAPKFYEGPKLLNFLMKEKKIIQSSDVVRFALERLEHNSESFIWFLDFIKLNFPDLNVDMKELSEAIKKERYDFFDLITTYHQDRKKFFYEIVQKEIDFDWLRSLFNFMQNHLVKILFPEEIKNKNKLSKYDNSILDYSESCDRKDLKNDLDKFLELEILAKKSDPFLIDRLRLEILK